MQSLALKEKLETLPTQPGVYLFKDREGGVLYVGKARVLRDRVRQYFQAARPADPWRDALIAEIADLDMVLTDSEMEALALENNFIKRHQPRFNVLLRDDKNHPYLKLTLAEEYPRLYVVRKVAEDENAYGGPYIPASLGRRTASLTHKIFGVRSCKEVLNGRRPRPCLQFQIGRCIAPCVAEVCSLDRYRLQEWLNYVASELHKSYGPLFRASEEQRPALREALTPKLDFVARHLDRRQFVMGDRFTVADAYLFTVLNWSNLVGIDLGRWPALKSYLQRVSGRPAVRATLEAEGLLRG